MGQTPKSVDASQSFLAADMTNPEFIHFKESTGKMQADSEQQNPNNMVRPGSIQRNVHLRDAVILEQRNESSNLSADIVSQNQKKLSGGQPS